MIRNDYFLSVFILVFLIIGCVSVPYSHDPISYDTHNTSTGASIHCIGNMNAPGIVGHEITIDQKEKIEVKADSKITIYLNPGAHNLKFITKIRTGNFPVWWAPTEIGPWGDPIEKEIVLKENEIIEMKFKAPWCKLCKGTLEIVKK